MTWSRTPWAAWNGLGFGLVAGGVFALAQCAASLAGGRGALEPVRYAASVLLGARALTEGPLGLIIAAGLAAAERRRVALAAFEHEAGEGSAPRRARGETPD